MSSVLDLETPAGIFRMATNVFVTSTIILTGFALVISVALLFRLLGSRIVSALHYRLGMRRSMSSPDDSDDDDALGRELVTIIALALSGMGFIITMTFMASHSPDTTWTACVLSSTAAVMAVQAAALIAVVFPWSLFIVVSRLIRPETARAGTSGTSGKKQW